jgi:hypothetical protein
MVADTRDYWVPSDYLLGHMTPCKDCTTKGDTGGDVKKNFSDLSLLLPKKGIKDVGFTVTTVVQLDMTRRRNTLTRKCLLAIWYSVWGVMTSVKGEMG